MKKAGLVFLLLLGALVGAFLLNPAINPSHSEPYLALASETLAPGPTETEIIQRVLIFGDAGHSTIDPWQASLSMIAKRATISPAKTAVLALGDNIYMRGYPRKEDGQQEWDEDQLESISFLDAQLKIATESGASMFFVPGNHDWYATEVDSQAEHIAKFAIDNSVSTRFEPWEKGQIPLPESVDLPGVSLVFVDSEWFLNSEDEERRLALAALDQQLARIQQEFPDNLIVVNQHHPLMTEGPHGGYFGDFSYWLVMNILYMVTDEAAKEDTYSPRYQQFIKDETAIFSRYNRLIHAAGHEHSLQLFKTNPQQGADYLLVSGAGNTNKVSAVWHNDATRFALSKEGFMELDVTANGVYIQVFAINNEAAVAAFWLDI